jgi:hypothetical protein
MSGKQGFAEDYIPVNERIALFVAKYPEGSLRPLWPDEPYRVLGEGETKWLVYGACAYRWPDDPAPGVGMAWEPVPGRTPYTKGSELDGRRNERMGPSAGSHRHRHQQEHRVGRGGQVRP